MENLDISSVSEDPPSKKQKKQAPKNQLSVDCAHFLESKWKMLKSVQLKAPLEYVLLKHGNSSNSAITNLLLFIPEQVWTILQTAINRRLASFPNIKKKNQYRIKDVTVFELLQFYGIHLLMESTYGNDFTNLRAHFAYVKEKFGGVKGLGLDRFEILRNCLVPTVEEIRTICEVLGATNAKFVERVTQCTIDESLIGYQPSKKVKEEAEKEGKPIPVVYIQRKPHPNGLLNYLAVCYVEHPAKREKGLPFVISILPHLTVGDTSPHGVVRTFMKQWLCQNKPHWVADAAFGSEIMLKEVEEWGGSATFSMSISTMNWMWNVLSANSPTGTWRAAMNEKGWIASSHTILDKNNNRVHQQLLSNGFKGVETGTQTTNSSPIVTSTEFMPIFERETLMKMKIEELKEICKKWNIKIKGNKPNLADNIVTRSLTLNQDFGQLKSLETSLQSHWNKDPALMHDYYKCHFNAVDLVDCKWNQVEEHHQNQHWEAKMILTIL